MSAYSESAGSGDAVPAGLYRLDPVHAFALFSVKHMVVGRVDARFNTIAGSFVVTDDPSRLFDLIEVSIDAASVDTKVDVRDEDLRSARFFDVSAFPSLTFRGRSSKPEVEHGLGIAGDLTIREVTQQVTFDVTLRGATVDTHGRTRLGASATTALSRLAFDLTTELE